MDFNKLVKSLTIEQVIELSEVCFKAKTFYYTAHHLPLTEPEKLMAQEDTISAIKCYRNRNGCSLAEAHIAVSVYKNTL